MESEGKEEEIDTGFVVGAHGYADCLAVIGLAYRDLFGDKLDIVFFGFVDDGAAEVFVGVAGFKADACGDLPGDVPNVGLKLKVGDLRRGNLPADENCQGKKRQSEDEFGSAHCRDPFCLGPNILR